MSLCVVDEREALDTSTAKPRNVLVMCENHPNPEKKIVSDLVKEDSDFAHIVLEFVEGLSSRLTRMEEALRDSDLETLRVAAHQLKGSGGGYGYPILTDRAAKLEIHAKAGELQQCIDAMQDLRNICSRVVVGP